ncbi:Ig-like domain-containing protein [uncultured Hymenobacter sp.]|uniref:Ig-like domain-containing protein n=1 Tax=uncultured Hymenobacter sp. TaxID=170016 RepID=UPI0035CC68F3
MLPTPTLRFSLLLRQAALLPLLCLSLLTQAQVRYQFPLYGSLSYQTGGAGNRAVTFKVRKAVTVEKSRQRDALPRVGDELSRGQLDFGDGSAPAPIALRITAVDETELTGEAIITHTYATAGNYTASTTDCCLLPNLQNNAGQPLGVRTVVAAGSANGSPVAAVPTTTTLGAGQAAATYQLAATDPDGDALTYSLATAADLGHSSFQNVPDLSVNARTGLVSFNTSGVATPQGLATFNPVIKVSDGKTSILVSHFLRVVPAGLAAPTFTVPGFNEGQVRAVTPGQTIAFTVQAANADAAGAVTLRATSRPPTSVLTPPLPASGNSVQTTFSWTPTAAEAGTYVVSFEAINSQGLVSTKAVTIRVALACEDPAATQPVARADQFTTPGTPLQITEAQLLGNDTDPSGRVLQVGRVGFPTNGTVTTNGRTYTFTPAPGFMGQATFTYQVLAGGGPNSLTVASVTTGHYYEFITAPGICWEDAKQQAAQRSYYGLQGYLATVTSAEEKDVLAGRFTGQYWFGASDAAVEGEWRWQTGPETGQLFWRGAANGTAQTYAHWADDQPDDFKNQFRPAGEDFGCFYGGSGLWNDLDQCGTSGLIDGYVVEYGGLEECTPLLYATGTVTITVSAPGQPLAATPAAAAPKAVLEALPNPSSGQFRLRVTAATAGPAQVDLFDLQGRRVKSVFTGALQAKETRELAVDAPELAAGVYVVRLQSGRQVQHLRIAIHK